MKLKYLLIIPLLFIILLIIGLNDNPISNIVTKKDYFDYLYVKSSNFNELSFLAGSLNNKEITIISLEDYQTIYYDYVKDNIFLYLEKKCSNCENKYGLYQINLLNEVYKEVLVKDLTLTEYTMIKGLVYYDNHLLIKSVNNDYLLKYSLSDSTIVATNIKMDNKDFYVYGTKELLIYHLDNNIYEYSFRYDKNNILFEKASVIFLKDHKFIYGEWESDINYKLLKEYSYLTNKTRRIGPDKPNETYIDSLSSIYPSNTDYAYIASLNKINIIDVESNIKPYLTLSFNPDAIMHLNDEIWIYQHPNKKYIYNAKTEELKTYNYIISNIKYKK